MIKFINSHQQALEDHSNVYKNASASETMQNANMYNAYAQCNYQTQKTKRKANKTYKANQGKVSDQKCDTSGVQHGLNMQLTSNDTVNPSLVIT